MLLLAVNASLAFIANHQSVRQFESRQSHVRDQQARQLRAMLSERGQEMSKLASLVPLLGPREADSLSERLRLALDTNGAVLDLEWDIRSVHWLGTAGETLIAWPDGVPRIPAELRATIEQAPESVASVLACRPACGQFQAIPLLWRGVFAGSLVLERSLADALLTFNALTGAEIAIDVVDPARGHDRLDPEAAGYLDFPVITFPEQSRPVLRAAGRALLESSRSGDPILTRHAGGWFEIFRIPGLAEGVDAYVINDVTEQRLGIQATTRKSLLIGALGLLLSELLLLMIMQAPLRRLKHLATALPLLAERRYLDLRDRLARFGGTRIADDEIDLMVATVGRLTERMETLQQDREQAEARLLWLSDHDPLTRLMNRRRFKEDFTRIVDQATRYGHQGALLFLDLDEFKDVNDLNGHQVGDSLLQRVAEELRGITQPSDLLARLGGDEFALVLPEASLEEATAHADAAQRAIRSITLSEQGRQHRISASIGIARFPAHGSEIPELMANADLAMYQAKEHGRGRWHLFSAQEPVREQLDARILWKEQIAEALRDERFALYFQPIIDIRTGVPCHMEALLRMIDYRGAVIGPDRFIPIAEKTGQIQAIDQWILTKALGVLARHGEIRLAINLSASAMDDPTILTTLQRLLSEYRITPSRLSFEVTETVAIGSLSRAARLMRSIQELGCRFALDDFGSGYASYAYLRQLPVDDIKIDGAFIRDLPSNREDRIFVKAVTDMAHGMDRRVIAEFVETEEVLEILRELGVDCAQGYLFGKPAPLAEP
nr:EAL domain-containing protein [Thiocystis violacea]